MQIIEAASAEKQREDIEAAARDLHEKWRSKSHIIISCYQLLNMIHEFVVTFLLCQPTESLAKSKLCGNPQPH